MAAKAPKKVNKPAKPAKASAKVAAKPVTKKGASAPVPKKLSKSEMKGPVTPKTTLQYLHQINQRHAELSAGQFQMLPIAKISPDPRQPRDDFRRQDAGTDPVFEQKMAELRESIAQRGVLQPINVRAMGDGYYLIAGERRWRSMTALAASGRKLPFDPNFIPALVSPEKSIAEIRLAQLAENLQREDLTDLQVAFALRDMMEESPELKKKDLAKLLGKPPSYVSRIMSLLDPRYAELVDSGILTYATLLEQFRALPQDKQKTLVDAAKTAQRPITITDIREAADKARKDKAGGEPAPKHNTPDGQHTDTGASTDLQQAAQSLLDGSKSREEGSDGAGESINRFADSGAVEPTFSAAHAKIEPSKGTTLLVNLTREELGLLEDRKADIARGVSMQLRVDMGFLQTAVTSLGGDASMDDEQGLVMQLHKILQRKVKR